MSGIFVSPKGCLDTEIIVRINPYRSGTDLMCQPDGTSYIVTHDAGTQSITSTIRTRYHFLIGGKFHDRHHRTKNFFFGNDHIILDVGKYGWLDEISLCAVA